MITNIFFVRHAESDYSIHDDILRPLTKKGILDTQLVVDFFGDKEIDVILSSPFKRAIDTIKPFSEEKGIEIEVIDDFRERRVDSCWLEDFNKFTQMQWEDFEHELIMKCFLGAGELFGKCFCSLVYRIRDHEEPLEGLVRQITKKISFKGDCYG